MTFDPHVKIGRNEPCPCGSGRKYKDCHLRTVEAERSALLKLRQTHDVVLARLLLSARDSDPAALEQAFGVFWNERYQFSDLARLNDIEGYGADRFLVWATFDYRGADGLTEVERMAAAPPADLPADALPLLQQWQSVRLRPYVIERSTKQSTQLRDMLTEELVTLDTDHRGMRLESGDVLIAHLLPPLPSAAGCRLGGPAVPLTPDTAAPLKDLLAAYLAAAQRENAAAGWDDVLRQHSAAINHFVLALPTDKPDPERLTAYVQAERDRLLA
jgi:hypothetical protein